MTPALVAAAIAAPLLRPEPWSAVALQQASSPDGALHCSTAPNECKHSARASTGSRWPTEEVHARTLWPCTADGGGLSSVSAEPAALHSLRLSISSVPCIRTDPEIPPAPVFKGTLHCAGIEVPNSPLRSQELIATSRCTWTMAAAACCHPDEASICRHCTVPHEKTAPKDLGVVMFAAAQDASTGAPAKHQVRGCSSHSRRRG